MTGLDETQHLLLEVSVVVTDWQLRERARYHAYVKRQYTDLRRMSMFARRQFWTPRADGVSLVHRCIHEGLPEAVIDAQASRLLDAWRDGQAMLLAGSTVHADRVFLRKYLPCVHARLHYQHVDVTSLLKCVQAWCPQLTVAPDFPRARNLHCAADDIQDSIALLAYFKRLFSDKSAASAADTDSAPRPRPRPRPQPQLQPRPSQSPHPPPGPA